MSNNDNGPIDLVALKQQDNQKHYFQLLDELRDALLSAGLLPYAYAATQSEFAHV